MAYIRAKKIKSEGYLYLVKSVWDSEKNTSKLEIIKYLGKASQVVRDDLPDEYKNDPKILSVLEHSTVQKTLKKEKKPQKFPENNYTKN